jgi:hypothetical protein
LRGRKGERGKEREVAPIRLATKPEKKRGVI